MLISGSARAFNLPERLEYELRWLGISAGTAALEAKGEGKDRVKITSTAFSAKWISAIYPVVDLIESICKDGSLVSLNYRIRLKEGKFRRDREVVFAKKTLYIDHLSGERREFALPAGIFDPLSAFYSVRRMDLVVGRAVYVPVFDSKKVWSVEVRVLRKETIKTPAGKFNTIVIQPVMQSEGIFFRKGDIFIWLTDDSRKVPVKLKTDIAVGSISAVLTGGRY